LSKEAQDATSNEPGGNNQSLSEILREKEIGKKEKKKTKEKKKG